MFWGFGAFLILFFFWWWWGLRGFENTLLTAADKVCVKLIKNVCKMAVLVYKGT